MSINKHNWNFSYEKKIKHCMAAGKVKPEITSKKNELTNISAFRHVSLLSASESTPEMKIAEENAPEGVSANASSCRIQSNADDLPSSLSGENTIVQKGFQIAGVSYLEQKIYGDYLNNIRVLCDKVLPISDVNSREEVFLQLLQESATLFVSIANQKQGKKRNKPRTLEALCVAVVYSASKKHKESLLTIKEILGISKAHLKSVGDTAHSLDVKKKQFTNAMNLIHDFESRNRNEPENKEQEISQHGSSILPPSQINPSFLKSHSFLHRQVSFYPYRNTPFMQLNPSCLSLHRNQFSSQSNSECLSECTSKSIGCGIICGQRDESNTNSENILTEQKLDYARRTLVSFFNEPNELVKQLLKKYKEHSVKGESPPVEEQTYLDNLRSRILQKCETLSTKYPSRVARNITATSIFIVLNKEFTTYGVQENGPKFHLLDIIAKKCDVSTLSVKNLLKDIKKDPSHS